MVHCPQNFPFWLLFVNESGNSCAGLKGPIGSRERPLLAAKQTAWSTCHLAVAPLTFKRRAAARLT